MISQLASVFSSQGTVVQGSRYVAVPRGPSVVPDQGGDEDGSQFQTAFDQAAARLELSDAGLAMAQGASRGEAVAAAEDPDPGRDAPSGGVWDEGTRRELTYEEMKLVEKLEARDREVRSHEQAHLAAAGGHARGGASFEYESGPDGRSYAVSGHVDIDAGPVEGNPEATLQKAMAVQRAALAPAEPSGADRAVAAQAAAMAREAMVRIQEERAAEGGAVAEGRAVEDRAGGGTPARRNPYAETRERAGREVDLLA